MGTGTGAREAKVNTGPRSVLIDNLEVCRMLGVRPDTWRKRVGNGLAPLPHSRQGARSYYRRKDVNHFLRTGAWPEGTRFLRSKLGRPARGQSPP